MNDEHERITRRRIVFVGDARRRLATLSDSLLAIERNPDERAALEEALRALHTLKGNAGFVGLETVATTAHALERALANLQPPLSSSLLRRGLDALSAMVAAIAESVDQPPPPIPVVEALIAAYPDTRALSTGETRPTAGAKSPHPPQVTVPVTRLDRLLEIAEALRANHSELARYPAQGTERTLIRQRRLLHELHYAVLETRLLPVGQAFEGFEQLVHDLAENLGRQARLVIKGTDTEIDRSALEPVRELAVHLLHNALAHGLEPPEERLAVGKPAVGTIQLVARPERDGVAIEVTDDGRGLDRGQVAARAVALGLCTAEEAAAMEDARLWALLARPGFSTHNHVDPIAGRGIGLSAVRQGVEALRGRLEITSQPGQRTTFRLWLPPAMVLQEVVLVQAGAETYAIPQAAVNHACRPEEREHMPTIDLRERLQAAGDAPADAGTLIVCARSSGQVGLLVDGVVGRDAAVIVPLPRRAQGPGLLGAIVTGNERVVLVLDVERL